MVTLLFYAYINLADPVLRSPGIGNVQVFGAGQYAMRKNAADVSLGKRGFAQRQRNHLSGGLACHRRASRRPPLHQRV
jgi:hypothetical protein